LDSALRVTADEAKNYVLLTGATGLVGQYLLRDLLSAGLKLAVLVRPKRKETAEDRIERILQKWEAESGESLPRPVILAGDVSEANFGFSDTQLDWVKHHCDRMIHNAAILKFHASTRQEEPWQTNLSGTRHAIEIAEKAGIKELHYMSTAYVCGNRNSTILESDFDDSHGFRNAYEHSKYEAEKLVRSAKQLDSVTIYRPVVISGDSQTGYTSTYHGLYVYLRLFSMFVPEQARDEHGKILTPVKIPLDGDEPRNVVPVDWIANVFCEIFQNTAAHGRTYHLAPKTCLTPSVVIEACYEYFNSQGAEFCGSNIPSDHQHSDFAEKIFDNIAIYQQYESNDPHFDTANLEQFAGHLACPEIDSATIHRYLDFGNADEWGKKRPLKLVKPDVQERRA